MEVKRYNPFIPTAAQRFTQFLMNLEERVTQFLKSAWYGYIILNKRQQTQGNRKKF